MAKLEVSCTNPVTDERYELPSPFIGIHLVSQVGQCTWFLARGRRVETRNGWSIVLHHLPRSFVHTDQVAMDTVEKAARR